ncbi:MAG TPA: hypothetical protein VM598_12395 [Bdellovibrionota bacterium]|nr:hypothetical protein [Bdellovibrionota bacterium]
MRVHHAVSDVISHEAHREPARVVFRRRNHPHARIMRTFVVTFTTWSLFLVYMLAFSV